MDVVFRADASIQIGTGHVMRCLTLADALREHGSRSRFVCRAHDGHLLDLVRRRGFEAVPLATAGAGSGDMAPEPDAPAHAHWLGVSQQADARQTLSALGGTPADWMVVDHYALDARWERAVAASYRRLMVIDDLADRPHACDLLLDQNPGRTAADYDGLVPDGCTVLAGAGYALLRPNFARLRAASLQRRASGEVRRLLVSMGGVDKDNATGRVLKALRDAALPADCRITIVLGSQAPWLPDVRADAAAMPWPTEVLVDVADMAALLADCDLAVGAAGTSAAERCCLGLPTLTAVLAANQRPGALALEACGAVALIAADAGDLAGKIAHLLAPDRLLAMQRACSSITDGEGTARVMGRLNDALR